MATVPNPRTWVDGEVVTPGEMNTEIRDAMNFLLTGRPICKMITTTAGFAIPAATSPVTFQSIDTDTDGMCDLGAYAYGFTVQTSGLYLITAQYAWDSVGSTQRRAVLITPETDVSNKYLQVDKVTDGRDIGSLAGLVPLASGDQVRFSTYTSASTTGGTDSPFIFGATWMAAL